MTHTPGPWTIEMPNKGTNVPIIHGADNSEVASVFADEGPEQREANARLIAAAPNLLAELVAEADFLATTADALRESHPNIAVTLHGRAAEIRAAIAKTEGAKP